MKIMKASNKLRKLLICCYFASHFACLNVTEKLEFTGDCTYENVLSIMESDKKCTEGHLFKYLGVKDSSSAKTKVEEMCAAAESDATDSFFHFSSIANAGYQFDREFMNGGSDWNNEFSPNLSRIKDVEGRILSKRGITFPEHLYNFDTTESCDLMAAMCCWVSDSSNTGDGTCSISEGCQEADPYNNTDICFVNIKDSSLASHTASGTAVYPGDAEGSANCMGFTWTNDSLDPSNIYKGNLLFEVAMNYGLKNNGYTRSVPHAPMCACVEQMPVVSHADCRDLEAVNIWSISLIPTKLPIITQIVTAAPIVNINFNIAYSRVSITFNDCNNQGLADYYETVHSEDGYTISDRITGECKAAESSFIVDKGFVKQDTVEWVKVAGKGSYAEPSLSEQLLNGTHSSMTRVEFEELWAKSQKILLRRCKYCQTYYRYVYYKRYDEDGLPPNVDILHDVKEHWYIYENNTWKEDFELYSTFYDALNDQEPWLDVNANYYNIGFARNAGPDGYVNGQDRKSVV